YLAYGSPGPDAKTASGGIFVGSIDGKERRLVRPEQSNAAYVEPGYLLFYRDRNLVAQPFDLRRLQTSGEPLPGAHWVSYDGGKKLGRFSVSSSGTLAYVVRTAPPLSTLRWFDRAGHETGSVGDAGNYEYLRLSPDGRRVVVSRLEPDLERSALWTLEISRATTARATAGSGRDGFPAWVPDGRRAPFSSASAGGWGGRG